ncbi:hypothetical protein HDU98_003418 [Podochytrium sp. JEL0797]|nr:hypothetical protein HDU98_003418 [Podochytrium sp. JEL0797]
MAATLTIRRMLPGEEPELTHLLTTSFSGDPLATFIAPDQTLRNKIHTGVFSTTIADPSHLIEVAVSPDTSIQGVAVWKRILEKEEEDTSPSSLPAAASAVFDWVAENSPPTPYWYLAFLASSQKGNGAGTALIRHRFAEIQKDAEVKTVALWTANRDNIGFYARFGFNVVASKEFEHGQACWFTNENALN